MTADGSTTFVQPRRFGAALASEGMDIAVRLSAAIRTIDLENRHMRAEMARMIGLSDNEFGALAYISEVDQPTPKALVRELGLTTGAVTAMIDRLEATGLIERRPHPSDRRSTVLALTPAGEHAREWIYGSYRHAIAEAIEASGGTCADAAIDILLRAASAIRIATDNLNQDPRTSAPH